MMKLLSLLAALVAVTSGAEWTYEGAHGPTHWGDSYSVCSMTSQSPIDVDSSMATYRSDLNDFMFSGYDATNIGMKLMNNGHAAQVGITGDVSVSGGGLPEAYKLAQFHFHWGSSDMKGSEHTMNGMAYPMEMHLVHYADSRTNLSMAADKPQGLAVLGFFFAIGPHNNHFDEIVNNLAQVTASGATTDISSIRIETLFPVSMDKYYRYSGSLTTPGCFQSVIWTVFQDSIMISADQMAKFRELMGEGHHIEDNFRPIQSLNGRSIFTNDAQHEGPSVTDSASSVSVLSAMFTVTIAVVTKMLF